jgi:hypothetical protein
MLTVPSQLNTTVHLLSDTFIEMNPIIGWILTLSLVLILTDNNEFVLDSYDFELADEHIVQAAIHRLISNAGNPIDGTTIEETELSNYEQLSEHV